MFETRVKRLQRERVSVCVLDVRVLRMAMEIVTTFIFILGY